MYINLRFTASLYLASFFSATLARPSLMDVVPPDYMPPPWQDPASLCHPRFSSSIVPENAAVCDPSALLSKRQFNRLNSMLADIYTGTAPYSLVSCDASPSDFQHGFRVAVALVRRMSFDGRTLSTRAEKFANTLFDNWSLNQECGAGVLLFLSLEDRRIFIRTGRLAVKYLNEHQIDDVYANIIPQLANGRIAPALNAGVSKIGSYLSKYNGKPGGARNTENQPKGASVPLYFRYGPEWWDLELSIVVVIGAALVVIACCNGVGGPAAARKRRERTQVLRKLDILRSEYVSAMLPQYVPMTCPYCQGELSPPWVPTVPTLASTGDDVRLADQNAEDLQSKPVRTLRCGHSFHETCFDDEHPGLGSSIPECPVCGDRGCGTSIPIRLSDTRQQDVSFRLHRLREEYPHILTEDIVEKLKSESPNTWPDPMTDAYLRRVVSRHEGGETRDDGRGWWPGLGVGELLAAGGLGALIGSMFAGWGRRREGSYYTNIPSENGGGHVGQWGALNSSQGIGGGHGTGWGNALIDGASQFSGGGGGRREGSYYTNIPSENGGGHVGQWGAFNGSQAIGGGHGTGWGNALSDAASRFSGGGGWGRSWGFGGSGGGNTGGGGHGTGW